MNQSKTKTRKNWATLPLSRVSTIMRSSPDVSSVSPDAIALTAKAAELFIAQLAKDAYQENDDKSKLDYNDISTLVNSHKRMAFLQDIIPKKIKVKEYFEMLKQMKEKEGDTSENNDMADKEEDNEESEESDFEQDDNEVVEDEAVEDESGQSDDDQVDDDQEGDIDEESDE